MAGRNNAFYWTIQKAVWAGLRLKYSIEVHGAGRIPRKGGVILVANHCSYLDPPVVGMASPLRPVRFMGRDTLYSNPVARWFFPRVGLIALDRTKGDLGAMRTALGVLKNGEMLGLFPEGTRSPTGKLQAAKGGIGFLLAKSGVPVVPLYVKGTYEAFPKGAKRLRPGKIEVTVGEPIPPETIAGLTPKGAKADYGAVGAFVMRKIAETGGVPAPEAAPQ